MIIINDINIFSKTYIESNKNDNSIIKIKINKKK